MAEQVLVQVRVDKKLKEEVSEIYEMLGLDLPTAIRMFLVRSKLERGLPFTTRLPKETVTRPEALDALDALFQQASGAPDMTPDEINAEIAAVRAARKAVNYEEPRFPDATGVSRHADGRHRPAVSSRYSGRV